MKKHLKQQIFEKSDIQTYEETAKHLEKNLKDQMIE
jgi:hypothetical protein